MVYLEEFIFPDANAENDFFLDSRNQVNCYSSYYPFQILAAKGFKRIDFEPITILSGSNGSGKSTALNVIGEKLRVSRNAPYNGSPFFGKYVNMCKCASSLSLPAQTRLLTSDDVFDYMIDLRKINDGVDTRRNEVFAEYKRLQEEKYSDNPFRSMEDYDRLKTLVESRKQTISAYTKNKTPRNVRTHSNGETALRFFMENIKDGGLYLLDEPENSLSAEKQCELADFLSESARFFDCQFVISTHSVFLLAMKHAKIYDLDTVPVDIKDWTELEITKCYRDFFVRHENEF